MNNTTVDFSQAEAVRKHAMLTIDSMRDLLGVSRVTYYKWIKGGKIRKAKAEHVRRVVKDIAYLIATGQWPIAEAFSADQKTRLTLLKEAIKNIDSPGL